MNRLGRDVCPLSPKRERVRERAEVRRLERQHLVLRREQRLDLGERGAGACGQHQLLRLVVDDAGEPAGAQHLAFVCVAVEGLAAAALDDEWRVARVRGADALDQGVDHQNLGSSGCGSWPPRTCIAPHSAQRCSSGTALPGLSRVAGSNAAFTSWKRVSSGVLNCAHIWLIFSSPTPCSPVMVPPTSTHSSRILPPKASACSSSPGWLASNRISGCRLPSPAWNTLATARPYSALISLMRRNTCGKAPRGMVPSMQ